MLIVIGIIILLLMLILQERSKSHLTKISKEFYTHDHEQRKRDLASFKSHLVYLKFSKFLLEKVPWIAISIIIIIVANVFGLLIILGALLFKRSLKDTNYRGYNNYQGDKKQMNAFDQWLVVANQTVLNNHKNIE